MEKTKKHLPLATQIFIALVLGIITGSFLLYYVRHHFDE